LLMCWIEGLTEMFEQPAQLLIHDLRFW
jgi:hypothetical protein